MPLEIMPIMHRVQGGFEVAGGRGGDGPCKDFKCHVLCALSLKNNFKIVLLAICAFQYLSGVDNVLHQGKENRAAWQSAIYSSCYFCLTI